MQEADKATQHREPSRQRASFAMALGAKGEIGAEIGGTQPIDCAKTRQLSQMLGQEVEEEGEVAPIRGDRVSRCPALACQPRDPQPDRRAQIVGGRKPGQRHRFR